MHTSRYWFDLTKLAKSHFDQTGPWQFATYLALAIMNSIQTHIHTSSRCPMRTTSEIPPANRLFDDIRHTLSSPICPDRPIDQSANVPFATHSTSLRPVSLCVANNFDSICKSLDLIMRTPRHVTRRHSIRPTESSRVTFCHFGLWMAPASLNRTRWFETANSSTNCVSLLIAEWPRWLSDSHRAINIMLTNCACDLIALHLNLRFGGN